MKFHWKYVALSLFIAVILGMVELTIIINTIILPVKADLVDVTLTNQALIDQLEYLTAKVEPPPANPLQCTLIRGIQA